MLKNLASSLILTERDAEFDDNPPKVQGRVTTTLHKAKTVRPLIEKCITIARKSLNHKENAKQFETDADRNSAEWKKWRDSDQWRQWCDAIAPAVAARRRCLQLLGDKQAVQILFDTLAPRFEDRNGGYTRILRVAQPRLGDAGVQGIIEFVGIRDREAARSEKPSFGDDVAEETEEVAREADGDSAVDTSKVEGLAEASERPEDSSDTEKSE